MLDTYGAVVRPAYPEAGREQFVDGFGAYANLTGHPKSPLSIRQNSTVALEPRLFERFGEQVHKNVR
jgi:hypothetical protein